MTKDLKNLMESEGFVLFRKNKHLIWRDANGVQIVTSSSPSCRYQVNNVRRDIQRARKHVTV